MHYTCNSYVCEKFVPTLTRKNDIYLFEQRLRNSEKEHNNQCSNIPTFATIKKGIHHN